HVARNDRNESLRRSWTAATATPDRRPSDQDEDNFSEDPLEQLNPFPFPGNVWVEGGALDPGAVFGRRFWVEHLERVAAARGARHDTLGCLAIDRRRRGLFRRARVDR